MTTSRLVRLVAFALAATTLPARAATATVDLDDTTATFSARHLTITTVTGAIPVTAATIVLGSGDVPISVKATLDVSKLDSHDDARDGDLRSGHWFDVARYPTMTFASTSITGSASAMTIVGELTFHGQTHPVTLAAKFAGSAKDGHGRTQLGYSATGTLDRTVWGVGTAFPSALVSDEIAIAIDVEAIET